MLRQAAAMGDPAAQYRLDLLPLDGFDAPADPTTSVRLQRFAATQAGPITSRFPLAADPSTSLAIPPALRRSLPAGLLHSPAENLAVGRSAPGGLLLAAPGATIDVETLRQAAAMDDPEGQYQLGLLHLDGFGVPLDPAETVRLHRLAAEQGHVGAHFSLRTRYIYGQGVSHDLAESARWMRALAEQGHAGGQSSLSFLYLTGRGVEQNGAESARWMRMAAEQNIFRSYKYRLGLKHFQGEGITQDYAEAARWFEAAADLNGGFSAYTFAERLLALMYRMGFGVTQDHGRAEYWYCRAAQFSFSDWECNPNVDGSGDSHGRFYEARLRWAQSSSVQSRAAAVQQGDPAALYYFVSNYFRFGYIYGYDFFWAVPPDSWGSIVVHPEWSGEQPDVRLLALAEEGNPEAQYYSGLMYANGYGVPQDDAEAAERYRAAAEQGHAGAHLALSTAYEYGRGVPQDLAESARWLRLLADGGNAFAQHLLAGSYRRGEGVPQDNAEAVKWYRSAAEQEYISAYASLGDLYLRGEGVPQDDAEAAKWYRLYGGRSTFTLNPAERRLLRMHYHGKIPQDEAVGNAAAKLLGQRSRRAFDDYLLGLLRYHGKGVEEDIDEALSSLYQADSEGSARASLVLAALSENGVAPPSVHDEGVVLATLDPRSGLSPNALATAFGSAFAGLGAWTVGVLDESGRIPTQLAGVCLTVDGVKAPLLFVSPGQINFQVPAETSVEPDPGRFDGGRSAEIEVIADCGTAQERRGSAVGNVAPARSPDFFVFPNLGTIAAQHGSDYTLVGEGNLIPGATPAKPGEVVVLYGTGFGAVSPALASGELAPEARSVTGQTSARMVVVDNMPRVNSLFSRYRGVVYWEQGTRLDAAPESHFDADVLYAGATPGFAGLYQVNVRIPQNAPAGILGLSVTVTVDDVNKRANGLIVVADE